MNAITTAHRIRLSKVLGMIRSPFDNESLTAARKADQIVRTELGVTWDDVLRRAATSTTPAPASPRQSEPHDWRELAASCARYPLLLDKWEAEFIGGLGRFPVPVSETADPADDDRHTAARGRVSPVSAATGSNEFAHAMGPVARAILGEPTEHNHMKGELRFGTRGSLSVDLGAGTFYDHEAGIGGGVLDFVQIRKNRQIRRPGLATGSGPHREAETEGDDSRDLRLCRRER